VTAVGAPSQNAAEVEAIDVPDDWASWLAERRFFYDVVVLREPPGEALAGALRATQPQAIHATGGVDEARLDGLLRAAGAVLGAQAT